MSDEMSLAEFIAANHIRMAATRISHNPNLTDDEWAKKATHWHCIFDRHSWRLPAYFSMGAANKGEPTTRAVLGCLAADAAGYENAHSFEDWAREYGYDTDSRRAEAIYTAVGNQVAALVAFLGAELYHQLLWEVERQ